MREYTTLARTLPLQLLLFKSFDLKSKHYRNKSHGKVCLTWSVVLNVY